MNYEWVGRQKKVSTPAQSPLEKGAGGLTLLSEFFFNRKGRKERKRKSPLRFSKPQRAGMKNY